MPKHPMHDLDLAGDLKRSWLRVALWKKLAGAGVLLLLALGFAAVVLLDQLRS